LFIIFVIEFAHIIWGKKLFLFDGNFYLNKGKNNYRNKYNIIKSNQMEINQNVIGLKRKPTNRKRDHNYKFFYIKLKINLFIKIF
jgi:hypothetical protein